MIFAATQFVTKNVLLRLCIGCILYLIALLIIANVFGDTLSKTAKVLILAILLIDATYMVYTSIHFLKNEKKLDQAVPIERYENVKPRKARAKFNIIDSIKLVKNKKSSRLETSDSMPSLIPVFDDDITLTDF
jgi:arginine exporter protein ArgO